MPASAGAGGYLEEYVPKFRKELFDATDCASEFTLSALTGRAIASPICAAAGVAIHAQNLRQQAAHRPPAAL